MAYDLKSESEVKEYIHNLGIEYRFGCYSEKKPEVCHLLGDYLEAIKKDFEKASKVFKNNCDDYQYSRSCHKFGTYMLVGRGQKQEDHKTAYRYFDKACDLNEPDSCLHQGLMLLTQEKLAGIDRDVQKGLSVLQKACDGKNANACYYLSGMFIAGVRKDNQKDETEPFVVQKDMEKAFKYSLKGCNLGNMYCCANLSQMYSKGEGTPKDQEKANKYKKMALEMQDEVRNTKQTLTFQQGLK